MFCGTEFEVPPHGQAFLCVRCHDSIDHGGREDYWGLCVPKRKKTLSESAAKMLAGCESSAPKAALPTKSLRLYVTTMATYAFGAVRSARWSPIMLFRFSAAVPITSQTFSLCVRTATGSSGCTQPTTE
jgi:hypothetical protein